MSKVGDELRDFYEDLARSGMTYEQANRMVNIMLDLDYEMVELPKDADNKPINIGDTVFHDGTAFSVTSIMLNDGNVAVRAMCCDGKPGGGFSWYTPDAFTHDKPDSLERIADELEEWSEDNRINGDGEVFRRAGELADRIRKLGGDAE
jgi:hypothetical protein